METTPLQTTMNDLPKIPFFAPANGGGCTCKEGKACDSPGKHPILKWDEGSVNKQVHAQWAEKYKGCNWGVVIRPSFGVAVIDIDVHKRADGTVVNGFDTLRRMGWELPQTVTVSTGGGGKHYYYYAPHPIGGNKVLGEGVELKVQATLVTPPSRHESGRFYVFDANGLPETHAFAELPQWVYDELDIKVEKPKTVQAATTPKIEIKTPRVKEGGRHNHIVERARRLRWRGLEKDELEQELLRINKEECDPPLPEKEVRGIAAYFAKKPSRRQISDGTLIELAHKDDGHAAIFYEFYRDTFCFAEHMGSWMLWGGVRWNSIHDAVARKFMSDGLRYYYKGLLEEVVSRYDSKIIEAKLIETYSVAKMYSALDALKGWSGVIVEAHRWDANPYLFNLLNCTLDTKTLTVKEHDPADFITKLAPVMYDPQATAPKWQQHLERFLPNPNVRRQVLRDLALGLIGKKPKERLISIWLGDGANGKSTTARVIRELLGGYATFANPEIFIVSNFEKHPVDRTALLGRRLVFCSEIERGKRFAEAFIKQVTGGEPIQARFMRQNPFDIPRTFNIILETNYLPEVKGYDTGIWRRFAISLWNQSISDNEARPQDDVVEELLEEAPGILNTLIAALRDIKENPNWRAQEDIEAVEEYRRETDPLERFISDACKLGEQYSIPKSKLYEAYIAWCANNGEVPISHKEFTARLRARGIKEHRTKTARYYIGIDLK